MMFQLRPARPRFASLPLNASPLPARRARGRRASGRALYLELLEERVLLSATLSDIAKNGFHNTVLSFALTDFTDAFSDPDGSLTAIEITALPSYGILTLNGSEVALDQSFDPADVANLSYTPEPNYFGEDVIGWNASDEAAYADTPASINITIQESAPTLGHVSKGVLPNVFTAFQASDFNARFSDNDPGDNQNLQTIQILSLPASGTLLLSGAPVAQGQTITVDQIADLSYQPVTDFMGVDGFSWNASDGSEFAADPANFNITVTNAPLVSAINKDGHHNTSLNFAESDFLDAFVSPYGGLVSIEITSLPAHGTLTLNGSPVTFDQAFAPSEVAQLSYTPDLNYLGADVFGWNGADVTTYAESPANINITLQESAPTVGDVLKRVPANASVSFEASNFNAGFSDADAGDNQHLQVLQILTLPTAGTLFLSGEPVSPDQTIPVDQIPDLTYVPATDYTGSDSFSWTASDGSEFAAEPAHVNLTVADKSVVSDIHMDTNHHTALNFAAADFTAAFVSFFDQPLLQIQITALPSHGALTLDGQPVTANQIIDLSAIDGTSAGLSYLPAVDFSDTDAFSWTGTDGVAFADTPAAVDITVHDTAPTVAAVTRSVGKNVATAFALSNFSAGFADTDAGDSLQALKIVTLPSAGRLMLNGLPVAVNQVIPSSQIPSLTYTPHSASTTADAFTWTASDGSLFATANAAITLSVTDAAPTVSDFSPTVSSGRKLRLKASNFTAAFSDADPGDSLVNIVLSLPTYGTLSLNGVPIYNSQVIPLSQLGHLSYKSIPHFSGTDIFYWNASDGTQNASSAGTISIQVIGKAPSVASISKGVIANATGMAFSSWDFTNAFSEPNAGPILQSITVSSLPKHGTLTLSGANVTAGQVIAATNIANLSYRPASGYVGPDSFKWKASDGVRTSRNSSKVRLTVVSSTALTVSANGALIPTGSTRTSPVNFTDFGPLGIVANIDHRADTRTFTITNNSPATITLTGGSSPVRLSGRNPQDFSVSDLKDTILQTSLSSLAPGQSATFTVTFAPTKTRTRTATVRIPYSPRKAFTFHVSGAGLNTFDNNATSSTTYGLQYATLQAGTGDGAASGNVLTMNYTGYLLDGTRFDSSLNPGRTPFQFQLGASPAQVITGWDPGLVGITLGEKRVLILPASLAYGSSGQGSIPANATLVFIVQCLGIGRPRLGLAVDGNTNNISPNSHPSALEGTIFPMMTASQSSLTTTINLFDVGYQDPTGTYSAQLYFTGFTTTYSISLGGTDASDFALNFTGGSLFTVTFHKPADTAPRTATVTVLTNDPVYPTFTFDIQASSGYTDLTPVLNPTSFPSTITSGDQTDLAIPLIVRNIGDTTSSGNTDIQIFAVNTSTQEQTTLGTLASQNLGGIEPHSSKALTLHAALPVGFAAGTYKLGVTLNPSGALVESNLSNNSATTTQSVTVLQGLADITGSLVSETLPASVISNATFAGYVTLTVANQGNVLLPADQQINVQIIAHNSSTGQDIILTTSAPLSVANLPSGQNVPFTVPVKYTGSLAAGGYALQARVLPVQALAESDTSNNLLAVGTAGQQFPITSIAAFVDFTAAIGTTSFPAGEILSGDRTTFSLPITITNHGNVTSTGSSDITILAVNASTGDHVTVATFTNRNLAGIKPGASRTLTLSTTLPFGMTTGTYELGVAVNPSHAIPESDYANNSASTAQTIDVIQGIPDLTGTLVSTTLPASIIGDQPINSSLVVTVTNDGNVLLPAHQQIRVNVLAHNIALNHDTAIATSSALSVASLAAGASKTFTVPITYAPGLTAGNYYLEAQIVPVPSLLENSTANNLLTNGTTGQQTFVAAPIYDLAPTLGTTHFPAEMISGEHTTLYLPLTVTNLGNITSTGNSDIAIFAFNTSTETQTPIITLTNQNLGGIKPGAGRTLTLTATLPFGMTTGTYELGITLNPSHTLTESTYTNNSVTSAQTIDVTGGMPDLTGALVSTTLPAGIIGDQPINSSLVVTVTNDGNVLLPSNQQITLTVLAHNTATSQDTSLANTSALSVASLAAGASKTFTVPIKLTAGLSAGDYILEARIIPVQALLENSTANNLLTTTNATDQHLSTSVAAPVYDLVPTLGTTNLASDVTSGDGTKFTLPLTIRNTGNIVSTGSSDITLFAFNTTSEQQITIATLANQPLGGIAPNGTRTMTLTATLPYGFTSGAYQLGVALNTSHSVVESNYTNNSVTTTQTVNVTYGIPDLTGTLVSTTLRPAVVYFTPVSGSLVVSVRNGGNVLLPSNQTITITALAHSTATGQDFTLGSSTVSVASLAGGASKTFTIHLSSSGLPGDTFLLEAQITPVQSLVESSTANNLITVNASGNNITLVSDIRFYDLTGTLASTLPIALAADAPISGSVNVTVANLGNVTLPSNQQITLAILAHNTGTSEDTILATTSALSVASLVSGGSKTFPVNVLDNAGLPAGNYILEAQISPVQTLAERSTANNLITLTAAGAQVPLTIT